MSNPYAITKARILRGEPPRPPPRSGRNAVVFLVVATTLALCPTVFYPMYLISTAKPVQKRPVYDEGGPPVLDAGGQGGGKTVVTWQQLLERTPRA